MSDASEPAAMRVVCAGHVNWDVTLHVDRLPAPDGEASIDRQVQSGGGSASNAAVVLAGLDAEPLLLGSVGTDENGWLVHRELAATGVETRLIETDGATAVKYIAVDDDGEVMLFGNDGANEAFSADDLPPGRLSEADHLHLTSQSPDTAAELASRAAAADVSVSFDPGRRLGARDYAATLANTDLLFCNEREMEVARDLGLVEAVPTVVEHGNDEATVYDGELTVSHPSFAVDPVDTAGAGDAFAAGFLAARGRGDGVERALAVGNACGALAARTVGARAEIGWRDVDALLDIGATE